MGELCGYAFQLGQPFHDGIFCELSDAVQLQLVHDVLAVRFYGFHAQVEAGGNVPGGFAFRKKLQHLALTAGKRLDRLRCSGYRCCAQCEYSPG